MTDVQRVRTIIDDCFESAARNNLDWVARSVPADMCTGATDEDYLGEYTQWRPVPSTVTSAELEVLSARLGIAVTAQYASVLQYKHFMQLNIGDMQFFPHPSSGWLDLLVPYALEGHPRHLVADRGFVPFARQSDWGLYCFDTRAAMNGPEYAVFSWDHDSPELFEPVADDLYSAIAECDRRKR